MTVRTFVVFDPIRPPNEINPTPNAPKLASLEEFSLKRSAATEKLDFFGDPVVANVWRVWDDEREFEIDGRRTDEAQNLFSGRVLAFEVEELLVLRVAQHELAHFLVGSLLECGVYHRRFHYVTALPAWLDHSWSLGHCLDRLSKRLDERDLDDNDCRVDAAMHWAGQVVEQLLYDESYDDAVVGDQRNIRELTKYAERHDIDCKLLQARNDAVVFMEEFLRNRWQTFNQLSGNLTKSGTLNAEEIEPYLIR